VIPKLSLAGFAAFAVALVACGGGDAGDDGAAIGAPFPPHITAVKPADGASVTNDDLFVGQSDRGGGICVSFRFQAGSGLGDDPTSRVQLFLNNEEVTGSLQWITTEDYPPSQGGGCYTPPRTLPAGPHLVTVAYSDLAGQEFEYAWRFTVIR
jgi:hypothetical protein